MTPSSGKAAAKKSLPAGIAEATIEFRDGVLLADVPGPNIGRMEAPALVAQIGEAVDRSGRGFRTLALDLSKVSLMSGMGLGFCIELHKRARARGADCVVTGLNAHLRDLFRLMRIDRLYRIALTRDELPWST